jgi:nicotinate-nucleotide pyrophosphorylase (carboxylating)
LAESILIKENHLVGVKGPSARGPAALKDFFQKVKESRRQKLTVEMEARNRTEILWGLEAGVDILLLDNFSPRALPGVVRWIKTFCREKRGLCPLLEVSGGVTLETVASIARSGVDRISIGRLTHSAPALDFNMDVQ